MTFWHVNKFLPDEKGLGRDFIQGILVSFVG